MREYDFGRNVIKEHVGIEAAEKEIDEVYDRSELMESIQIKTNRMLRQIYNTETVELSEGYEEIGRMVANEIGSFNRTL